MKTLDILVLTESSFVLVEKNRKEKLVSCAILAISSDFQSKQRGFQFFVCYNHSIILPSITTNEKSVN